MTTIATPQCPLRTMTSTSTSGHLPARAIRNPNSTNGAKAIQESAWNSSCDSLILEWQRSSTTARM